jgi:hypothetical protein
VGLLTNFAFTFTSFGALDDKKNGTERETDSWLQGLIADLNKRAPLPDWIEQT